MSEKVAKLLSECTVLVVPIAIVLKHSKNSMIAIRLYTDTMFKSDHNLVHTRYL